MVLEYVMYWVQSKFAGSSLDATLLKLQPIVTASFASGSLTAALLNLTAVAAVSAVRQGMPRLFSPDTRQPRDG
ncbi:hypothetical protein [Aurantiacibacter odishensis]|uniref:hypothetical protein n=1 Tax=Aurantiacibacter odishensis TaxID=1155476 RepID=UPI000E71D308|nr:hypothetical protein [Aurantiacibacter odishensis]